MSKSKKSESFVVSGKVLYATVHQPRENKGKPKLPDKTYPLEYSVLLIADAKNTAQLAKYGVEPKNTDAKRAKAGKEPLGNVFNFKTTLEPVVVDAKKNHIPKNVLIGNGSTANIKGHTYSWTSPAGEDGVSLALEAIQITNLVPYSRVNLDGFNEVEGFTADTVTTDSQGTGDDEVPF